MADRCAYMLTVDINILTSLLTFHYSFVESQLQEGSYLYVAVTK